MNGILEHLKGLEFTSPWALIALLLVPFIAWWLGRKAPMPAVPFSSLRTLKGLGPFPRRHHGRWRWALVLMPVVFIILATARPRLPKGDLPDPSMGIDIILGLDYSGSMTERDFHLKGKLATRAEALAHVVENFVAKRPHDRIGIIGFAKGPYLVSPLTLDHEWVLAALHNIVQSHGTAIGEAIVASVHFLRKASERSKILILVTDGVNSSGRKPLETAPFARKEGVRIYTVLVGPERLTGSQLAANEMLKVSRMTGGQLFQANDTHALQSVYDMIDLLEKRRLVQRRYQTYQELFPSLAWLAVAWLGTQVCLRTFRRRIP
jgi:Ca-activated chloride channel homolog